MPLFWHGTQRAQIADGPTGRYSVQQNVDDADLIFIPRGRMPQALGPRFRTMHDARRYAEGHARTGGLYAAMRSRSLRRRAATETERIPNAAAMSKHRRRRNASAYYVVNIKIGKVVAGPFSPVGKADRYLASHYSHETHQVIDGRWLTPHAFGSRSRTSRRRYTTWNVYVHYGSAPGPFLTKRRRLVIPIHPSWDNVDRACAYAARTLHVAKNRVSCEPASRA